MSCKMLNIHRHKENTIKQSNDFRLSRELYPISGFRNGLSHELNRICFNKPFES